MSVAAAVALKIGVLAKPVVGLAVGDAGAAESLQAETSWGEAVPEASRPFSFASHDIEFG